MNFLRTIVTLLATGLVMLGCASSPPRDVANLCNIFEDRRDWYRAADAAEQRWNVPIAVNMAFIYQESSFRARARPERNRILWIFPGSRPSSAYGYAQALDGTWQEYERLSGNSRASRSNFSDAIDFFAWYNANSYRMSDIDRYDARSLYLAYHEGNAGFQRGTHRQKQWLLQAADWVHTNALRFDSQLLACRDDLDRNWLQRIFSFALS